MKGLSDYAESADLEQLYWAICWSVPSIWYDLDIGTQQDAIDRPLPDSFGYVLH